MLSILFAVTDTALTVGAGVHADISAGLGQIWAAVVVAALGIVTLAALWARQKIEAATLNARAEALEAQVRVQKAESAAREAARLNVALVTKIETDTRALAPDEAKKTKSEFQAIADSFGVSGALKSTVEKLGFSSSSRSEIPVPKEDDK